MGVFFELGKLMGRSAGVGSKAGQYTYPYAERIADLAKETELVSSQFLRELTRQAYNKQDLAALKVIYEYMQRMGEYSDSAIDTVVRFGKAVKLMDMVGDPFAVLEKVVNNLC